MIMYIIFLIAICVGVIEAIATWKKQQKKDDVTLEEYRALNKRYLSALVTIFIFCAYLFISKLWNIQQ